MPKQWKTEEVCDLIKSAVPGAKIKKQEPGGDYDTTIVNVEIPGQASRGSLGRKDLLQLVGFKEDAPEDRNPDDMEINHVAMANIDADGRGGIQTRDKALRDGYYQIKEALEDAGFDIVDSMDDYF